MVTDVAAHVRAGGRRQRWIRTGRPPAESMGGIDVAAVRPHRSWRFTLGAVTAVLAAGLLTSFLYASTLHTERVMIAASDIDRGATITAQDLTVLSVQPGQQIDAFQASDAKALVGQVASVPLLKGATITHDAVAAGLGVPTGQAIVGVALKQAQLPSTPISAGDHVVLTPIATQTATVRQGTTPIDVTATVVNAPSTDAETGTTTVNVYVPSTEASDLAGRAAAGLVALYVVGGSGN